MKRVRVTTPATTANLGPGFDTLGLALKLYNAVKLVEIESGIQIECAGGDACHIPTDESNIVYRAAQSVFERAGRAVPGLRISLTNNIPLARGLGSSAAAIVGGAVAANVLAGSPLDECEMLRVCNELEGHPDNVVPALVGGFAITTVTPAGSVQYIRTDPPPGIRAAALVPGFELKTTDARRVLPRSFGFDDVVYNVGHAAFLVGAFVTGDFESLRFAMEDRLHQPYRESLIPGMRQVFDAAMDAGALSVAISGSGPTLIAFVSGSDAAIGEAMRSAWAKEGIESDVMLLELDSQGHRVSMEE